MINLLPVFTGQQTMADVVAPMTIADLRNETNELTTHILALLADCDDDDVTFQPVDPEANDPVASSAEEVGIAWTLGHVIVHLTAGNEEMAALAAEQARGVPFHGRSRYEVPWETMTTVAQLRHRLEESQRMCLGALDMWPDQPDLDLTGEAWPGGPVVDARGRYLIGIGHAVSHLDQIKEIIRQSHAAKQ
ncbi:DinB family protein [Candidatus Chloroploca asiatica]|uniref:DinB-like domain-containing protein n=1 Tax=Candidatus Chloroploca asiatica TaxID=1506545 RepID=A0A2H3KRY1_9CHLR|nr:DinB family protein [Candidatus Chloroploca asiatica]PDW01435.1 hypothetical protein A9Q02_20875 [Candidatus Chloroploca asiatica]